MRNGGALSLSLSPLSLSLSLSRSLLSHAHVMIARTQCTYLCLDKCGCKNQNTGCCAISDDVRCCGASLVDTLDMALDRWYKGTLMCVSNISLSLKP